MRLQKKERTSEKIRKERNCQRAQKAKQNDKVSIIITIKFF